MTNPNDDPDFDGLRPEDRDDDPDPDLPQDVDRLLRYFPGRLNRVKEASGLSWSGLAVALGVDRKRVRLWGKGAEPRGGSMLSLFHFASRIPGGIDILLGLFPELDVTGDENQDTEVEERDDQEQEEGEA
ncbi:MAG: hypothetical protein OXI54_03570 [Chloroflexota bacterium]|nr:hypothetical protein [Chloroflexota bacterium]MDE2683212.1 hypothetical protein [Chloroflexota bacterium]